MLSPPHPGRQLLSSPFRCDLGKGLYRISAQPPQPAERSAGLCSGSVESSERLLSSRGGWVCEILKGPKKAVWKQPRNSGPRAGSRVLKGQGYRGPLRQSKPTPCVFRDPSYRSVLPVGSAVCFALLSLDSSTQFGSRFSKIENGREGPVLLGLILMGPFLETLPFQAVGISGSRMASCLLPKDKGLFLLPAAVGLECINQLGNHIRQ